METTRETHPAVSAPFCMSFLLTTSGAAIGVSLESRILTSMKAFLFTVAALTISSHAVRAEPVAQLKAELEARQAAVNDWFKAELIKIALQARTDEERQKVLVACDWVWDAGSAGVSSITLKDNGTGVHHSQGGSFAWTSAGWSVKLVSPMGATAELKFDPNTLRYTGKDFDGKNSIKGRLKLDQ